VYTYSQPSKVIKRVMEDTDEEVAPRFENYKHDGGIKELIQVMCADKSNLHEEVDVIYIKEEKKGVTVELAMRWSADQCTDSLTGFANGIRYASTLLGTFYGFHVSNERILIA
jgi:DNA gyrase/topoisomerase IV subunit B